MKSYILQYISKYTILLVSLVLCWGCFEHPNYSDIPKIEFKNLRFIDVEDASMADSLILSIDFEDGDGDLGLSNKDINEVSVDGKTLIFSEKIYPLNDQKKRITYAYKRQNPQLNYPDYVKPYDCINWEIVENESEEKDTIYFKLNENHYNIFVDFYVKQNDGSFALFDWREKFCTTYDGRFPILSENINISSPLVGIIHYAMTSVGFRLQFSIKTLKLKVHIQDRLQRKSNEITTPEFQFR